MAFAATNASGDAGRPYSVGPIKVQLMNFSLVSGDTSGTITADGLTRIDYITVHGVALTAAPTFSGNVATLAFVDPAATRYGMCVVYGR